MSLASRLRRKAQSCCALVASAAVLAGGASGAPGAVPTLYVAYGTDCTFTLSTDGGITITPASAPGVIPPGSYQLVPTVPVSYFSLANAPCRFPIFQLTGPGVSYESHDPGFVNDTTIVNLQPSATYVADDESAPGQTRTAFTTAATGSSSSLAGSSAGSSTTGSMTVGQGDVVGSGLAPFRGVLQGVVSTAGVVTLTRAGKPVASLRSGRYDIDVADRSAKSGFVVQKSGSRPIAISGGPFVGKKALRVSVTPGRWAFYAKAGDPTRFTAT